MLNEPGFPPGSFAFAGRTGSSRYDSDQLPRFPRSATPTNPPKQWPLSSGSPDAARDRTMDAHGDEWQARMLTEICSRMEHRIGDAGCGDGSGSHTLPRRACSYRLALMFITAGPRMTMKIEGKMQNSIGNTIFTGAANAFSWIRWRRRTRISSAWTRRIREIETPN